MSNYIGVPVFFYIQNLEPGGSQPVMIGVANELSRRGTEVHLIANSSAGFWRNVIDPKIELHDLKAANSFLAVYRLIFLIRAARPKVILAAMTHANLTAILARMASFSETKIVISERHACSKWLAGLRLSRKFLFSRLIPWLYPRADGVIAVAKAAADDLSAVTGMARERIDVIYNPAPGKEKIDALPPPSHPWFHPDGPPLLLAAGRLEPQKDFISLIKAFAILRRNRAARLMILGEGRQKGELLELARQLGVAEDICLMGQVPSALAFMKHATLFVLSSRFEGLPNVLIEALACGTPVVSTDCESGPREILLDGEIGALVPVGDEQALAAAMENALDSADGVTQRRNRAADFTLTKTVDAYLEVLHKVIGQ